MVEDVDACKSLFDRILAKLASRKHFSFEFANEWNKQYRTFLQINVKADKASFLNFDIDSTRSDIFLMGYMKDSFQFNKLVDILKFVLKLSHGQSRVEPGFSVNKSLLVGNMQESSLNAQRLVLDHISANCFDSYTFSIDRNLIGSVKNLRQRYGYKLA